MYMDIYWNKLRKKVHPVLIMQSYLGKKFRNRNAEITPIPIAAPSKELLYGRSLLGLWVRILPAVWMSVPRESVV